MDFSAFTMLDRYEGVRAVTEQELSERWARLSAMMEKEGLGALLLLSPASEGANLWLTGERGQKLLVYYHDGSADAVYDGALPTDTPAHPRLRRCRELDLERLARETVEKGLKLGFVHSERLTVGLRRSLRERLPDDSCTDALLPFARVKAHKSPLEQALIREAAGMIQKVFEAFPAICREGRLYKDICDELQYLTASLGSDGEYMISMLHVFDHEGNSLTPLLEAAPGMRAERGHQIAYLLETNGPGGYYAVLGRVFSFGEPSAEFRKKHRLAVSANRLAGSLMRPGATARGIAETVNAFIRTAGYPTDDCCYMHSMGCSMGEDPALGDRSHGEQPSATEHDKLETGMQLHCHPHVGFPGRYTSRSEAVRVINMYLVGEEGGVRQDSFPEEIILL